MLGETENAGPTQTYGQAVVNHINFARGRIYPSFQVNASADADLYKSDRMNVRFQIDGEDLTDVLDVIDRFCSQFSKDIDLWIPQKSVHRTASNGISQ
jgi:hypothetical protein